MVERHSNNQIGATLQEKGDMTEHPTRIKVLDAVDALADRGIDHVTIDAISDRSGVTNGSIYHHFGSRAGALAAAAARAFSDAMTASAKALNDRSAETCVLEFVSRYVAWIEQNPNRATLMYQAPLEVDLTEAQDTKLRAFAPVISWVSSRAGELREVPTELLDPVVFGPVHETVRRWLAGDRATPLVDLGDPLGEAVWRIAQPE
jgi:AcrR family transcriptional regulator